MTTRVHFGRLGSSVLLGGALCVALVGQAQAVCVGDCNGNGKVAINELIIGVNIALGSQECTACEAFCTTSGTVPITRLIQGVNNALNECPVEVPTETPTDTGTPTPTETPTITPTHTIGPCAVTPGKYTLTQTEGGTLKVGALPAFAFPSGGTIVQDVGPAAEGECVHDVTVKFPGGLTTPNFCIAALGYTVSVTQTGCGIGKLDSNGGSDFTITEVGDTSDSSSVCDLPNEGCPGGPPTNGADSAVRVDVTVGDGTPDTCAEGTVGNAVVSIPVFTRTWSDMSGGNAIPPCPGNGVYDEGVDAVIVQFPQTLDFTTDTNKATWADIDGDECDIAGGGPKAGLMGTGTCLNFETGTVSTAASGTIGSSGAPLYDLTFQTLLPNTMSGPEPADGATCDTPPVIDFAGTATRCIAEEEPIACPIAAGAYTLTQVEGGSLTVASFAPFPFPAGGAITMDVGEGNVDCVHETIIGFPGGFSAPSFCIPALGFITGITQTGCGVGRVDSNGGSDFTVSETGDTSSVSETCNIPQTGGCAGRDSSVRVDITVGDGTPDVCTGGASANAIVAVPVFTKTWLDFSPGMLGTCTGDGVFNEGVDTVITEFPQILDFTSDANTAKWQDLDSDGCSISGTGPAAGFTATGECMDVAAGTVKTGAAGTIGSAGAPTFDLSFASVLPNSISGPAPANGVTCDNPPVINFTGAASRCLQ